MLIYGFDGRDVTGVRGVDGPATVRESDVAARGVAVTELSELDCRTVTNGAFWFLGSLGNRVMASLEASTRFALSLLAFPLPGILLCRAFE